MEKYQRLGEYLTEQQGDCCTLPFVKIEEIIGGSLPRSARNHRAWWANDETPSTSTELDAGRLEIGRASRLRARGRSGSSEPRTAIA